MPVEHKNIMEGRWPRMTLFEQLGNVGSEVHRARNWQGRDESLYRAAIDRALELMDFVISDSRWRGRLKEIARAREMIVDASLGGKEYGSTFEGLDNYFFGFAIAARLKK